MAGIFKKVFSFGSNQSDDKKNNQPALTPYEQAIADGKISPTPAKQPSDDAASAPKKRQQPSPSADKEEASPPPKNAPKKPATQKSRPKADKPSLDGDRASAADTAKEPAHKLDEATPPSQAEQIDDGQPLEPTTDQDGDGAAQGQTSWFHRLKNGLSRSSNQLGSSINAIFTKRRLDETTLQELEDVLIQADLGLETTLAICDKLENTKYGKDISEEDIRTILSDEITKVLEPVAKPLELSMEVKPHVMLVVGVNGTGKTTTIGKLAAKLSHNGLKVMLAAGDTFRAAAIEQLEIWAHRTKSEIVTTKLGADAASLAYEAYNKAISAKSDVLIIDTAGRLQNKKELMDELEKIVRVLKKINPDAPHTVLQTLDATTGQNALNQVEIFQNVAATNGLVMTKLDGTARGGILVAIAQKFKLPVFFIGVGEGMEDLAPFEAREFGDAIAGKFSE